MIRREDVFRIGKIGKPHGVKGEVSLQFTDDVFDRVDSDYLLLEIDGILVPFFLEEYRFRSEEVALVKFCDVDTQEKAKTLTGSAVFFPRELADSDEENVSWSEIVGFTLVDADNRRIGTIKGVDNTTINLLFDVETDDGRSILVPASDELITNIDLHKREIKVSLPDGILDL